MDETWPVCLFKNGDARNFLNTEVDQAMADGWQDAPGPPVTEPPAVPEPPAPEPPPEVKEPPRPILNVDRREEALQAREARAVPREAGD